MIDYKNLHFKLYAAMADAIDELKERENIEKAVEILINAHIEAEEIHMEDEEYDE